MAEPVKKLNILLAQSCSGRISELQRTLPNLRAPAQLQMTDSADLWKYLTEHPVDAIVFGPSDFETAREITERSYAATMILASPESMRELAPACIAAGILLADEGDLKTALSQLLALSLRLRSLRLRANTLQRKLDDTRLVGRAKLLLMSRLQMSESEAHRYIEKAAMDSGEKRRDVALGIIRAYEE